MTSAPMSLKRPVVRRMLAVLAGALAATAVTGAASARDVFKQDAYASYKGDAKNGEYMANAAGCASCHAAGDDLKLMAGGLKMDTYIGKFYVPNITADAKGIGGWSNADFLNAVLNGIGRDGRHLYPVMPYVSYAGMKAEDVLDIKAYLETLPKSDNKVPRHELSFPYNLSATIAFWKRSNFDTAAFQPGGKGQIDRGKYLVENVGACGECHTPRTASFGLDKSRAYEGEKGLTGAVAPDLTKARLNSVAQDDFVKRFLSNGMKLGGSPIADPVMRKFQATLAKLTDEDKLAMYAYLKGREIEAPKIEATPEAACKDESAQAKLVSAGGDANLAAQADEFLGKYCRNCHGPGESAQRTFPVSDLASMAANAAFVTPGDRNKSLLYSSVASGRMPLGKRPSEQEVAALGKWIDQLGEPATRGVDFAGGPDRKRPILAWRSFAQAALNDLNGVNNADRPFIRYFSYRHQFNGELPCEAETAFNKRMDLYRAGFHKLLNSVSLGNSLVVPETVKETKDLLVRVDIRDLGWDKDKWDRLVAKYPFGYDPDSDALLKSLSQTVDTELPILRVDWFMSNAGQPENYHLLLDLPEKISDLEKKMGIDVDDNIRRRRVIRSAVFEGVSGVSDHNRMLERHDGPQGGYYWKSYDFAGSRDKQDLKRRPHGPAELEPLDESLEAFRHDGGEMIFSLANGMQGYYLSLANGTRIDRGPTSIVSNRQRPIGKGIEIVNGRSCFQCHSDGTIAKRDQMREFVEKSPSFSLAQQELLLDLYVKQDELDAAFAKDRNRFVDALSRIAATERAPDGTLRSRAGPNKEEIITWYADLYEEDLDAEALAAEFDMTPPEFEKAVQRVRDGDVALIARDWITQVSGGAKVPRFEVEQQFAKLVKPLLNVDPLDLSVSEAATANNAGKKDEGTPEYKNANYRDDAFKKEEGKGGKLKLSVKVKNQTVFVDEKLTFDVTASNACELQIFYVEQDGNVEIIPQEMIGEKFLKAGETRRIPDPVSGDLVFDTPGKDETLLLFCREGGLGDQRLSAADAKKLARESGDPASRGLAIQLNEKIKAAEKAADAKAGGDAKQGIGSSAINMVTFTVKARK